DPTVKARNTSDGQESGDVQTGNAQSGRDNSQLALLALPHFEGRQDLSGLVSQAQLLIATGLVNPVQDQDQEETSSQAPMLIDEERSSLLEPEGNAYGNGKGKGKGNADADADADVDGQGEDQMEVEREGQGVESVQTNGQGTANLGGLFHNTHTEEKGTNP
ncbi:hypothetical protein FRC10_011651, partial [Ceratobasidium sp. 414]